MPPSFDCVLINGIVVNHDGIGVRDIGVRDGRIAAIGALGRAAAAGRGVELEQVEQRARDGITGPRRTGDIGFAALRGGDAVGDHHVIFAGAAERLELIHRANSRAIYAKGAIRAARWVVGRPPGVYGLKEVLGL